VWRYLDDGSSTGDAWRLPDFPDANWNSGPAQLGYGDGDEATVVSYGPNAGARHITTWFRQGFDVADASHLMHLVLYLVRDDGAVVYLNGQELIRDNMPAGPVLSETLASSVVGVSENQFHRYDVAASFLVTGRNVLAVEVHQVNPSSSDLSFDLELVAMAPKGEPLPVISIHASVPETIEPSPTTRVRPGEFTITRAGSTNEPLILFLEYGGTATPGHDYAEQPQFLLMPAGESALVVRVEPKDDALVEGDEIVTARLAIPPIDSLPNYHIDPAHAGARVIIHDNDFPMLPTLVSIAADDPVATEMDLTPAINPARFRITRTGDLSRNLLVFYSVHGSATPGLDYPALPGSLNIPSGESSATFDIVARFDGVDEGMETIYVRLAPSPLMGPLPTYEISAARGDVAIILDSSIEPKPAVEIVWPKEGDRFTQPTNIEIVAAAFHPTLDMSRVDFYAGDTKIGDSWIVFDRVFSGGLIVHRFNWANPPGGAHTLTARAFAEGSGAVVTATSPPVHITVDGGPALPVVRIEATGRIAEETSDPLDRLRLIGEFTISRTGPTDQPLSVFVHYSGTATPGVDYPHLPWSVTIPQGAVSTNVRVEPIPDGVREGIETLVATVSDCPPDTDPPLGMPCVGGFEIDPAHEQANVFIRDDGRTQASLVIRRPAEGAAFPAGETIPIEAIAIDLESYIGRVEFWDGDKLIGVSALDFFRAPDPGTPIRHWFEWRDATPGAHALMARAQRDDGTPVVSVPVHITVTPEVSQPPRIAITHPTAGAQFPLGTPIEIIAETVDPDGYVPLVEFFADGRKIGERRIVFIRPPDPGQPQTFTFVWRWPMPGPHVLTARATDDDGDTAWSAPVEIRVTPPDLLPIVRVIARDPWAVEPQPDMALNTAAFRIRRFGPTNAPLVVAYSLHGTAVNGVDYEALSGLATIPAGERSVDVIVKPLADDLAEGVETVVLRLEDILATDPPTYRVGFPRRAVALISDHPQPHATARAGCLRLPDGLLSVCFGAETGSAFRIEGSTDLRNWETVSEALALDGAVYFVDDEVGGLERRFYRLASDPFLKVNE
jgi:hypothetical protein